MNIWEKMFKPKSTKKAKAKTTRGMGKPKQAEASNRFYGKRPSKPTNSRSEFQRKFRKGFTGN